MIRSGEREGERDKESSDAMRLIRQTVAGAWSKKAGRRRISQYAAALGNNLQKFNKDLPDIMN